ncbi:carbohydrate esterase family 2 protein, partial [Piromyces sp. E2]
NQNSFEPTAKNVRIIGRTKYQDGYLWIGLTGAGIEYKFNGKVTTINVTADTTSYSEDKPAHIIIYADDEIYLDTVMTEKNMDFTVLFDKSGKHVIRFIKTSEALFGSIRINEIKADAKKISPTKPEKLRIEFIGDSITCGYGVDGTGTDVFTTRTEDGTKSYAIKTAKKFHAEYSIVAYSAFCLVPFLPFDGKIMNSLPGIYDRLGYSEHPNEFDDGVYELQNEVWDQQQYIPDLVVINLGTNDNYFGQAYAPDMSVVKSDYVNLYEKFLSQIRSLYPQTKILCTLGMMGQELYPEIEEAVNNYTTKTGDSNVKAFKLSVQNSEKNGFGTDNHPNAQSHVDATYELVGAIEKFFGW